MQFLPLLLLLLPTVAMAAEQRPMIEKAAGWLEKLKSYLNSAAPSSSVDASTSTAAGLVVETITKENWRTKMLSATSGPGQGSQEWMVMFSGNTSCYGRCERADQALNKSAVILATTFQPPKLGRVDCDKENLLCTTWSASIPQIWHFLVSVPTGGQSRTASPLHIVPIYPKNVTTQDIVDIHTKKIYLEQVEYAGAYHPIDGWLQRLGLLEPLGYIIWAVGSTPSWLFMIAISFFSRQVMARRVGSRIPDISGGRAPSQAGAVRQ